MIGRDLEAEDVRLGLWQRILRDEAIAVEEVDRDLLPLARDGAADERMSFILLRACVTAAAEMTSAMRRNLKAALIHWFSQTGSPAERDSNASARVDDLTAIVGQRLTWAESARLVGGNPDDYTAYRRLVVRLQTAVQQQWQAVFGSDWPYATEEEG